MASILLGSVALEPNRWRTLDPSGAPRTRLSEWLGAIAEAGFDGVELWDRHLAGVDAAEARAVLGAGVPFPVFNSYASLDRPEDDERHEVARLAERCGSRGVKFNTGNDPSSEAAYAERIARWLEVLPGEAALLCECHHGISIAEDPEVARRIFAAAGPPERVQAIVHSHEAPDAVRRRFDAYGERIRHVHVNFLDFQKGGAPRLEEARHRLEAHVALLHGLGFRGSYTLEFVHGLLGPNDEPGFLLGQAAADLPILRQVVEAAGASA